MGCVASLRTPIPSAAQRAQSTFASQRLVVQSSMACRSCNNPQWAETGSGPEHAKPHPGSRHGAGRDTGPARATSAAVRVLVGGQKAARVPDRASSGHARVPRPAPRGGPRRAARPRQAAVGPCPSALPELAPSPGLGPPEMVVRWHRAAWKLSWRWKSRPRPGRPRLSAEARELIAVKSRDNPLLGPRGVPGPPADPERSPPAARTQRLRGLLQHGTAAPGARSAHAARP